ncbi:MAG TPA: glucosidase [bacterium]|nr:glucosidase [bacterium]
MPSKTLTEEQKRLDEDRLQQKHWRRWGPYLSERQWGTVREDYSRSGDAWNFFPHDHARSRAYRWGEDGIAGISDNHQKLCFALAFWNEEDPILKERYFGLNGGEGNHGEDVKEYYYYLDSTPTHSYMKCLYKYPHRAFPYTQLLEENRKRGLYEREFELMDTGIFAENRYFDIFVEYAKATPDDILIRIKIFNRGPEVKTLRVLPTLWYRNTWSWDGKQPKPSLREVHDSTDFIEAVHSSLGKRYLFAEGNPEFLFTENDTNNQRLFGVPNKDPYVKDGIHDYIIHGRKDTVKEGKNGTKASLHYHLDVKPGKEHTIRLRLTDKSSHFYIKPAGVGGGKEGGHPFRDFDSIFEMRLKEADEFYENLTVKELSPDHKSVQRQALAGMLWSKQYYHYVVEEWLDGDPAGPTPPSERKHGRNANWEHLYSEDILSMPDKWEYPWFASWDMAFHCIPLALADPEFAKKQLMLFVREWYMHPNGQIPAYEWNFEDVNPPVHAWATWRVYKIDKKRTGKADRLFLERVFQKLLLNFTWWVNRKDVSGKNIFQGGFLGLDNISIFDRSEAVMDGGHLDQSDATSWMGMFCLNMLAMALELAKDDPAYEDIASKFYEHFLYIAEAMNHMGEKSIPLWNDEDGVFYDVVHFQNGQHFPLKVRSMVGLIPLFAVETLEIDYLKRFPGFRKRYEWFVANRQDICAKVACMRTPGVEQRRLLSIVKPDMLKKMLQKMLDESEFFSPYGIRALSKYHKDHPYILHWNGTEKCVSYDPGDSTSRLFGGNSNWRGPVWFPVNFLILESLQKFHHYLGDDFKVECPTGSGIMLNLWEVAQEISMRMTKLFMKDRDGKRPVFGTYERFNQDPHWRDYVPFHEYFHGDYGWGVGASHQTGWTGVVAKMIQQYGEYCCGKKPVHKKSETVAVYSAPEKSGEIHQCGGAAQCGGKHSCGGKDTK